MSQHSSRRTKSVGGQRLLARYLLRLIPHSDQRELIREDLDEELRRRSANGRARPRLWYWAAALESVADWWIGTLSWRSTRAQIDSRGVKRSRFRSDGWLSDVRFAFRMVRRERVVSAAVVITVLLGVASTAAVAAVLQGVLLRPLPYPGADQIVRVSRTSGDEPAPFPVVGLLDLEDWQQRSTNLSAVAGWSASSATLSGMGRVERISVAQVTLGLDRVLDINPTVGRLFRSADFDVTDGSAAVVSHSFWMNRFGGDPAVLGRTVDLDSRPIPIVGVLPPTEFAYPPNVDVWLPLAPAPDSWRRRVRGASWLNAVARVRSGTPIEIAEQEMSQIQRRLVEEFPRENDGQNAISLEPLGDIVAAPARPAIRIMGVSIGVVLLLASINVGLLLLARANRRREEFSVRVALGGDLPRLARLVLTEALVLAAIGGALGLPLALPLIEAMVSLYPGGLPRSAEIRLDAWVVGVSFLTIFLAAGLASLAPALGLRKLDLGSHLGLRGGSKEKGQTRARNVLVSIQLAAAALLLIGATLLSKTLANLRDSDPGFAPDRIVTFSIAPATDRYQTQGEKVAFYRRLFSDLDAIPGVVSTGGVNFLPFGDGEWIGEFEAGGESQEASVRSSWPGYYETLGLTPTQGRLFDWRDGADGMPVALLNEAAARAAFNGEDAVGRQIEFEGETREIVGVLPDVRHRNLVDPPAPEVHVPTPQFTRLPATIVIRVLDDPHAILPAARGVVSSLDPNIPLTDIATMDERIEESIASERYRATLVSGLGGLAAVLALIGVYGVMSYAVALRRREIGIRFALGEPSGSIRGRVLKSAAALSAAGVGVGVLIAWIASRWLDSLLYGVDTHDPWTFLAVSAALLAAGTTSAVSPAIRASRVDPLMTIREE